MTAKKKNFTSKDKETYSFIGAKEARSTSDTKSTSNTTDTTDIKDITDTKEEEYRFSARFTALQGKYLEEKKWRTRKTITTILQELVAEDMKKHPEIIEGIDELNG